MKNMLKIFGLLIFFATASCNDDERIVFVQGEEVGEEPINSAFPIASEVVLDMRAGFNLGNVFDNGNNPTNFESIKPIIDLYKNAGMKHVRIPTTWMDRFNGDHLADENGNLNTSHPRFIELVKSIDYALSLDMYVVLNTHHEHWLKDHYDGTDYYDLKFQTLWTGIANFFKGYPNKLLFEVLNEPEGTMGELDGNGPFPDPSDPTAIEYTRRANLVGYDAIRATAGNNATRIVMMGLNGQGNALNIESIYPTIASLPGAGSDHYLAIQVHSYNPWAFCGETGSNAAFPGTAAIEKGIQDVSVHAIKLKVPINYGEFGVGRSSNNAERDTDLVRGYYRTMAVSTLGQKMSYSVWDDRGWFGLVNNSGTAFVNNIVPFILQ